MHPLFLQAPAGSRLDAIRQFVETFWPVLLPSVVGLAAVYLLLPRVRRYPPLWGGVLAGLALALAGWLLIRTDTALPETVLFYSFAGIAVVSGGLLITLSNPVHAALSFALVVLSTCGLFLLRAAPFLMAATIIIYAGAIVVTFLFVIMLAQQEGFSSADQRSREPFLATVAGFVLLGALLCVLQRTYETAESNPAIARLDELLRRVDEATRAKDRAALRAVMTDDFFPEFRKDEELALLKKKSHDRQRLREALDEAQDRWMNRAPNEQAFLARMQKSLGEVRSAAQRLRESLQGTPQPREGLPLSPFSGTPANADLPAGAVKLRLPADNVAALGRALFSDYLLAIELGGVLLLVATIGAIAIAGRRREGLR